MSEEQNNKVAIRQWDYRLPKTLQEMGGVDNKEQIDVECPIEGVVTLKSYLGSERLRMYKSMQFMTNDAGELVNRSSMDMLPEIMELAEKSIVSVDAKNKTSGYEYKSMEELSMDEDGVKILTHLGQLILNGRKLGKL